MGKLFILFLFAQLLAAEAIACSSMPIPGVEPWKSPITVRVGDRYFTFPQNLEAGGRGASKPTSFLLFDLPAISEVPKRISLAIQETNLASAYHCSSRLKITEKTEACAASAVHFSHPLFQKILRDASESAPENWVSDLDIQRELGLFVVSCDPRPQNLNPERLSDTTILYALTHENEAIREAAWRIVRKETIAKKLKYNRLLEIFNKEENKLVKSTAQNTLDLIKPSLNLTAPAPR